MAPFLMDRRNTWSSSIWISLPCIAMCSKAFLWPITNGTCMHSFERILITARQRHMFNGLWKRVGPYFIPTLLSYSKFKSEQYSWLRIFLWETMWKTPKDFFTSECRTWHYAGTSIAPWLEGAVEGLSPHVPQAALHRLPQAPVALSEALRQRVSETQCFMEEVSMFWDNSVMCGQLVPETQPSRSALLHISSE